MTSTKPAIFQIFDSIDEVSTCTFEASTFDDVRLFSDEDKKFTALFILSSRPRLQKSFL